ncbi:MAG: hypothetical protein AB7O37_13845 [Vicinamibacteria bacterium]
MRLILAALVPVHLGLAGWAVVGLAEWLGLPVPWPRISDPWLPRPVLLLQWLFVLTAACVLVAGFAARWRRTPAAMAACYGAMAALCAVENLLYLGHYGSMALEYATYVAILAVLFRSDRFRAGGPGGGR